MNEQPASGRPHVYAGPEDTSTRALVAWRAARDHLAALGLRAILPVVIAEMIDEGFIEETRAA
ncbi:hypothetical protein [Streptosporangium sp. NPDC002524]|uniref:hypothetical protein n=1 Tax=Streptosporangium sp. NPDC002524 TaxID=3154537 RepID=UPI00332BCFF1